MIFEIRNKLYENGTVSIEGFIKGDDLVIGVEKSDVYDCVDLTENGYTKFYGVALYEIQDILVSHYKIPAIYASNIVKSICLNFSRYRGF